MYRYLLVPTTSTPHPSLLWLIERYLVDLVHPRHKALSVVRFGRGPTPTPPDRGRISPHTTPRRTL